MKVLKYCPVCTEGIFLEARKLSPDFIQLNGAVTVIALVELWVNKPAFWVFCPLLIALRLFNSRYFNHKI